MAKTENIRPLKGKQFRLVKFFAYASFIVLALASFPFSVVISQQAKDLLTKSYENYALFLGENLNHQVFQNFVIPVTMRFGQIRLREKEQHDLMDRIVKNTTHSFKMDMVNIYDIGKGVVAYSTDPEIVGKKVSENPGYLSAVKGKSSSRLLSEEESLWGLGLDLIGGEKKLRTYIPFRKMGYMANEKGYVLGVFELIQDLTTEYKSTVRLQYVIFGLSLLIMGFIFIALLLIVHKAENILEQRAREQRELQAQLDQAERLAALGQMCAGVSHEIRNPLGIIRSTAELLGTLPDAQETQKNLSGVIVEESTRLNNIVTEFLDFARPSEPNLQDCYLDEIITRNLSFLGPHLAKHGIIVNKDLNRPLRIKSYPQLLYRSFLNILMNSVQSMKQGGEITIEVNEDEENYILAIKDTGSGIRGKDLGKIFNPFFSTKDEGSGLGLPIVRNIIEGHRGSIWIESDEGSGTMVFIKLPRA